MTENNRLPDSALLKSLGLKALAHIDTRSDEEIEVSIADPKPVKSEKNVWAYWTTGWSTMRPWNKRNVIGWVRLLGPSWTVRVLDRVPGSSANVSHFIKPELLPKPFNDNTMTGRTEHTHSSDMVRLPLIYQWGGVYLDVGIMLFMHLDDICWRSLQDVGSRFQVALPSVDPLSATGMAGSFIVASRKGNGFIRRWIEIFKAVWRDRIDCQDIHADGLFRHLIRDGSSNRLLMEISGDDLDYFSHVLSYERVRNLADPSDGFDGPNYCKNKVLLMAYRECASAALLTNDDGEEQFRLLRSKVSPESPNDEWVRAQEFTHYLLSNTAMMKLSHHNGRDTPSLATLWDRKENADADIEPGTFAELLRRTAESFTQERIIETFQYPADREKVFSLGVLEEHDDEADDSANDSADD